VRVRGRDQKSGVRGQTRSEADVEHRLEKKKEEARSEKLGTRKLATRT